MTRSVAAAVMAIGLAILASATPAVAQPARTIGYRVLATTKTSTMEKEMNDAAASGLQFGGVIGGETAAAGEEVVVVMARSAESTGHFQYKLLATNRTSTMQKELQDAGDAGFEYRGHTVFKSVFSGEEVVIILERDRDAPIHPYQYRLLATSKTGTMDKELAGAAESGFEFVGLTLGKTAVGGRELVVITRRDAR